MEAQVGGPLATTLVGPILDMAPYNYNDYCCCYCYYYYYCFCYYYYY